MKGGPAEEAWECRNRGVVERMAGYQEALMVCRAALRRLSAHPDMQRLEYAQWEGTHVAFQFRVSSREVEEQCWLLYCFILFCFVFVRECFLSFWSTAVLPRLFS